jgi:hypothetical protein
MSRKAKVFKIVEETYTFENIELRPYFNSY